MKNKENQAPAIRPSSLIPQPSSFLRWGLVGYGDLAGKRVAAALRDAAGCSLAGVWGRQPEKTRVFAAQHGIAEAHQTLADLIGSGIDAVYICTPPDSHAEYALAAISSGKHVLVEKPMAANAAECERMIAAARSAGVTLGVAYYRRAYPKMQKVRQLIAEGVLGVPTWVNIVIHSWFNPAADDPKHWRVEKSRSGGAGALADVGVHRFDLLDYWLGESKVVHRSLQRLVHSYEVEDGASVQLELANGAPVHAYFSWNSKTWLDRFEIVGSEGKIILDPLDGDPLNVICGRNHEEMKIPPPANPHLPCIEDFAGAVREKRAPLCDGEAGLRTNRLLEAIVQGDTARPVIRWNGGVFTPPPTTEFTEFIQVYYDRCRGRVGQIEGIAGKWIYEDLIPGLSDFDTRFFVKDETASADWCRMAMEVAAVHLELARERKDWARTLEHLPGVNLKWSDFLDPDSYYPEFSQWTFYHGAPARLEQARRHLTGHVWNPSDEVHHWKKIALYYGRYSRTIDPPINLGAYENKYPLHSRLLHYLAPPVHSGVCLMRKNTTPGKLDAFRQARSLFPNRRTMERVLALIELHYETPRHLCEPGLTELDLELEAYLVAMVNTLLETARPFDCPASPTARQLGDAVKRFDRTNPASRLFENVKFARFMKGRLWFYGQDVPWFDSLPLIQIELNRMCVNFFESPVCLFARLVYGKEVEADRALEMMTGDVFDKDQAAACRRFAAAFKTPCPRAECKKRALEIVAVFDPFLHALEILVEHAKKRITRPG